MNKLEYKNLLAACKGNQGSAPNEQHCDTRKGDQDIKYNPADSNHPIENYVSYSSNGRITSADDDFHVQIEKVLNLNYPLLQANRKEVIKAVRYVLDNKPGTRKPTEIKKLISKWETPDKEGKFKEYCGIAIFFLKKYLRGRN